MGDALYILESSVAVVPGALKRGLGRAGKPARLVLKDYFHILEVGRHREEKAPMVGGIVEPIARRASNVVQL